MFKKLGFKEFFRMLSLMKKRKWMYIFCLLGLCLTIAAFEIAYALVDKDMINGAVNMQRNLLYRATILMVIAVGASCIIEPTFDYFLSKCICLTMSDIRLTVFSQVEKLPIDYYDKNHSADIISRLTSDINAMEQAIGRNIVLIIMRLIAGIAALITMMILNFYLATFTIILGISITILNTLYTKPVRKISDAIQKHISLSGQRFSDMVAGFRVIKMFSMKDYVLKKYMDENQAIAQYTLNRAAKNAEMNGLNYTIGTLSYAGLIALGSFLVTKGMADLGSVVAIISVQRAVTNLFTQIGNFVVQLQNSLAGAARIFAILDTPSELERYILSGEADIENMIQIRDLCFKYNSDNLALDHINISVPKGQVAALVGASGGGKSTVLKLLLSFYKAEAGEISINGKAMREYDLEDIRNLIAYVPQESYLFHGTIKENLLYGKPSASKEEIINAAKMANAHDFILEMPKGYDTEVGERGNKLSGGQRQRIAIARALLKDAPILLLDEATSSLDSESEQLVQDALKVLMKGRTVMVVAHRLSTIENADLIYVIEDGKVKEQGKHKELLELKGIYNKLFNIQFSNGIKEIAM